MKDIHIKPALLHILQNMSVTPFTVGQLTDNYLKHPDCEHTAKPSARQYVYRKMIRMMELGQMIKLSNSQRRPRYQLTSMFLGVGCATSIEEIQTAKVQQPHSSPVNSHETTLKEKLSECKSEMLSALGESDEYSSLCNEHPELRERAQSLYNEARERSAMLLGKMKALENMLSLYAG
jgi:hypothetical protein